MSENKEPEEFKIETDPPVPDFAMHAKVIREIKKLGYDDATAARFARLIGSKPIVDEDGNVIVMEHEKILAKIKLSLFAN